MSGYTTPRKTGPETRHMWITWNHRLPDVAWPPRFEEKVEIIFYQRSFGWQLHISDLLANGGRSLDQKDFRKAAIMGGGRDKVTER